MKRVSELRQQAQRYRRLERQISDSRAVGAMYDLVDKLEMTAQELEQRHLTRERAYKIWIEQGRPEGREVEHWITAEREIINQYRRGKTARLNWSIDIDTTHPMWLRFDFPL